MNNIYAGGQTSTKNSDPERSALISILGSYDRKIILGNPKNSYLDFDPRLINEYTMANVSNQTLRSICLVAYAQQGIYGLDKVRQMVLYAGSSTDRAVRSLPDGNYGTIIKSLLRKDIKLGINFYEAIFPMRAILSHVINDAVRLHTGLIDFDSYELSEVEVLKKLKITEISTIPQSIRDLFGMKKRSLDGYDVLRDMVRELLMPVKKQFSNEAMPIFPGIKSLTDLLEKDVFIYAIEKDNVLGLNIEDIQEYLKAHRIKASDNNILLKKEDLVRNELPQVVIDTSDDNIAEFLNSGKTVFSLRRPWNAATYNGIRLKSGDLHKFLQCRGVTYFTFQNIQEEILSDLEGQKDTSGI